MTFEEKLPSLIGKWKSAGDFPKTYIVVPVLDVSRDCLDKTMVERDYLKKDDVEKVSKEAYLRLRDCKDNHINKDKVKDAIFNLRKAFHHSKACEKERADYDLCSCDYEDIMAIIDFFSEEVALKERGCSNE